ncbi:flagellar biosynthetic protein FliR [Parahaliea aestuarii]|uniref:Flagellar biosynthetic protein FliR n=1 Tax=Parahaliea aestuarii TaxID=1852021 RepID=A0A5C9A4X7_9GAMM|nr:flagellar biosynthetic protein FliR [Parahaliea aestuarii]TXS94780.1 flagellar biosynthetic protein FliR [Parahaliea aestuarii]
MIEFTFAQWQAWIAAFFWPFVRITAFAMASPLWGHSSVPRQVKLGLALLLCMALVPVLPPAPPIPLYSWAGIGVLVEQLVIGVAMGLTLRIMFAVVQAAGEFIGLQMGLGFATFVSPETGTNTMVLSRLFYMITLLMYLAVDGHLIAIEALAGSFHTLPVGLLGLDAGAMELLARFGGTVFMSGLQLALPLVGALLVVNLSLGILNRSAPQLTVFSVGFPMSLTLGIFLLSVLMTDFGRFLQGLFGTGLGFLQQLPAALAGLP